MTTHREVTPKAAVVTSFDRPLQIEDRPMPEPGASQVLVRIEASGLCHTDIHAARGEWPVKPSPPFVPGHEGVGIVERVGPGDVYGLEPGMRVALPWLGYACGVCRYCNSCRETLCEAQLNMGYALDGGFAEYAVGYARHIVQVPGSVDPVDASPLTCAGVTTYKAVKVSEADSSESRRRLRRRRPRRQLPSRRASARSRAEDGWSASGCRPSATWRSRSSRRSSAARRSRLDRRHAPRPGGGLRAAPSRLDPRGVRGAAPRRVNRAIEEVLDGSAQAPRLVFRMASTDLAGAHGHAHAVDA